MRQKPHLSRRSVGAGLQQLFYQTKCLAVCHSNAFYCSSIIAVIALLCLSGCALTPKPRYTHDPVAKKNPKESNVTQPVAYSDGDDSEAEPSSRIANDDRDDETRSSALRKAGAPHRQFFLLQNDARQKKLAAGILVFLNARYKPGGLDTSAVDCSGFVKAVFQEAYGKELPHKAAEMFRLGAPIAPIGLRAGDLVFFSHPQSHSVDHVGIYLSEKKFVHSTVSRGVMISSLVDEYWQRRFAGGRRL